MNGNNILSMQAKTSVGRVREHNEDHCTITSNIADEDWQFPAEPYINSGTGSVMAIADGMGGPNAGEIASKIAIDSIKKHFHDLDTIIFNDENILTALREGFLLAHHAILDYAINHPETEGMGTTLIVGWVINEKLYICWSGDSRCYHYSSKTGLQQISKDHSYVQSLVDEGKITRSQAFYHPQSNIITQSLGDREKPLEPDTTIIRLQKNDIVLMCSDGLSSMLTDTLIEEILKSNNANIISCSDLLIEKANAAGGMDNITIILLKVLEETDITNIHNRDTAINITYDGNGKMADTGSIKKGCFLSAVLFFLFLTAALIPFFILLLISIIRQYHL